MTRDEVLAEPSGRRLDSWITEKVMGIDLAGFEWPEIFGDFAGVMVKGDEKQEVKRYSTDISAAWEVVEKMNETHWFILEKGLSKGSWRCALGQYGASESRAIFAEKAPLAICRAALLEVTAV